MNIEIKEIKASEITDSREKIEVSSTTTSYQFNYFNDNNSNDYLKFWISDSADTSVNDAKKETRIIDIDKGFRFKVSIDGEIVTVEDVEPSNDDPTQTTDPNPNIDETDGVENLSINDVIGMEDSLGIQNLDVVGYTNEDEQSPIEINEMANEVLYVKNFNLADKCEISNTVFDAMARCKSFSINGSYYCIEITNTTNKPFWIWSVDKNEGFAVYTKMFSTYYWFRIDGVEYYFNNDYNLVLNSEDETEYAISLAPTTIGYFDIYFQIDTSKRDKTVTYNPDDEPTGTTYNHIDELSLEIMSGEKILPSIYDFELNDNIGEDGYLINEEDEFEELKNRIRFYFTKESLDSIRTNGLTLKPTNLVINEVEFGYDGLKITESDDTRLIWAYNHNQTDVPFNHNGTGDKEDIITVDESILSISNTSFDEDDGAYRYLKLYSTGDTISVNSLYKKRIPTEGEETDTIEKIDAILKDNLSFDFADSDIVEFVDDDGINFINIDFKNGAAVDDDESPIYGVYFKKDENINSQDAKLALALRQGSYSKDDYLLCVYGGNEKSASIVTQPFNIVNLQDNWRFKSGSTLVVQSTGNGIVTGETSATTVPIIDTETDVSNNTAKYYITDKRYEIVVSGSKHQIYISPNTISGSGVTAYGRDVYYTDVNDHDEGNNIKSVGDKSEWFKNTTLFNLPFKITADTNSTYITYDSDFSFSIEKNTDTTRTASTIYEVDQSSLGDASGETISYKVDVIQNGFPKKIINIKYKKYPDGTIPNDSDTDFASTAVTVASTSDLDNSSIDSATDSSIGATNTIKTKGEVNDVSVEVDIETSDARLGASRDGLDTTNVNVYACLVNFFKKSDSEICVKSLRKVNLSTSTTIYFFNKEKKVVVAYVPEFIKKENYEFVPKLLNNSYKCGLSSGTSTEESVEILQDFSGFTELYSFISNDMEEYDRDELINDQLIDFKNNILEYNGTNILCSHMVIEGETIPISNKQFVIKDENDENGTELYYKIVVEKEENDEDGWQYILKIKPQGGGEDIRVENITEKITGITINGKNGCELHLCNNVFMIPNYTFTDTFYQHNNPIEPFLQLSATTVGDTINIDYYPLYVETKHAASLFGSSNKPLFNLSDKSIKQGITLNVENVPTSGITAEYYTLSANADVSIETTELSFDLVSLCGNEVMKKNLFKITLSGQTTDTE